MQNALAWPGHKSENIQVQDAFNITILYSILWHTHEQLQLDFTLDHVLCQISKRPMAKENNRQNKTR